ncbi:MAG: hypothetical protein HDR10_01425 [Lachnospiraceae bacterium]|nr:hypothetical protein [Lachnospiraceae bacterium]
MKKMLLLKKAVFRTAVVSALSFFLLATPVYASEPEAPETPQSEDSNEGISLHSDIIDWRYKTVGGRLYRRRYNYTRDRWEDEYWIECV